MSLFKNPHPRHGGVFRSRAKASETTWIIVPSLERPLTTEMASDI